MKFIQTILLLLLFTGSAFAQWSPDNMTNLKISDTTGSQELTKVAVTSDGGCYISWFDTRNGEYAVYMQKLNAQGIKQFPESGLLISNNDQNTSLVDYDLITDDSNNAILVFTDIRNGAVNPFAYKISPAGSFLWGANGVALSTTNATYQPNPKVAKSSDGFIFSWVFSSSPNKIAMQKLSFGGAKMWGNDPTYIASVVSNENFTYPALVSSDNGSVIMVWSGYTGSFITAANYKLYSQKFAANGTRVWNATQDTVYNLGRVNGFYVPRLFSDGQNGAVYCWQDDRNAVNAQTGYVQRKNSAGQILFPVNGTAVSTLAGNNHFAPIAAVMPSTNETFVYFQESNSLQSQFGVYGQKISAAGTRLWDDNAKEFVPLQQNQPSISAVLATDTNVVVTYSESVFGSGNNILKAFRVGKSGGFIWNPTIITASAILSSKVRLQTAMNNSNMLILTWADGRQDAAGVYAQNINFNGTLGMPTGITGTSSLVKDFRLNQNYPNPFNPVTTISYQLPASGIVTLKIYDITGKEIVDLINERQNTGSYEINFDAASYSSGVYFYKLTVGEFTSTRKMMLIK